jgi:hypothetical protein
MKTGKRQGQKRRRRGKAAGTDASWYVRLRPRIGFLDRMALSLNAGHWPEAEAILGPSLPLRLDAELDRQAVKVFNELSAVHPVTPWIRDTSDPAAAPPGAPDERHVITTVRWTDREGEIVYWLWTLLQSPHRDRLKRCKACPAWFVDHTNGRMKLYCSSACHDKDWPRDRRRRQGHKAFRKSAQRRRRRS